MNSPYSYLIRTAQGPLVTMAEASARAALAGAHDPTTDATVLDEFRDALLAARLEGWVQSVAGGDQFFEVSRFYWLQHDLAAPALADENAPDLVAGQPLFMEEAMLSAWLDARQLAH